MHPIVSQGSQGVVPASIGRNEIRENSISVEVFAMTVRPKRHRQANENLGLVAHYLGVTDTALEPVGESREGNRCTRAVAASGNIAGYMVQ